MKTLKLFNAVIAKTSNQELLISDDGFIIEPNALWAKHEIISFYAREKLSGNELNKTFHKSWDKIKNSSRLSLFIDQIQHYCSTYGSDFNAEIYIPDEVLNVPDLKLKFKVIKALSKKEMTNKCLAMLQSGIALKEETVDDLLTILVDELDYTFTGKENIKNKEAIVKLAENYNVYPTNPSEFFRWVVYRATGETLLIKNYKLIEKIKESNYNPTQAFKKFGLVELSAIFNRFKPLFLAFKPKCGKTINKLSKLSKTNHKPMVSNPLNTVTQKMLTVKDIKWLENATPFALFKALSACYSRMNGQNSFVYRIRSGKSWAKEVSVNKPMSKANQAILEKYKQDNFTTKHVDTVSLNKKNYTLLMKYMKKKFNFEHLDIYIPKGVKYALPTSEKMFVGNIPTGTKFTGDKLAVGIYWRDSWGACDLDLSGLNVGGKVGWNSAYSQSGSLMYSGDITSAPHGAVEYLWANEGLNEPTLVQNNVFSGDNEAGYKIIVGKGSNITKSFMMNPNKVLAETKCNSVQKQTILGMFLPEKNKQSFVLLNFGAGNIHVSGRSSQSDIATKALYQQWNKPLTFKKVFKELGANFVSKNDANVDLSLDSLETDSFTKLF